MLADMRAWSSRLGLLLGRGVGAGAGEGEEEEEEGATETWGASGISVLLRVLGTLVFGGCYVGNKNKRHVSFSVQQPGVHLPRQTGRQKK